MRDWKEFLAECDAEIRSGHVEAVARKLAAINTSKVPRPWRLPLANACRRTGLYNQGLTLLNKLVQPAPKRPEVMATAAELAEYSVLLMRIGAIEESLKRLEAINPDEVPEVHLFKAYGCFYRWEFDGAIHNLESYLRRPLSSYAALVGRVNLAHALVESGRYNSAKALLNENIQILKQEKQRNLLSHCYVYRAQIHMREGDFESVRGELQVANDLMNGGSTKSGMIQKWWLISQALETKSLAPLQTLREVSRLDQDWEALREADLFSLRVEFDQTKFLHLVFGTPHAGYRQRIYHELGQLPDRSTYVLGDKKAPKLDLRTGEIDGRASPHCGRKCHQLIEVLLRDFYEPRRIGSLFHDMFPGEYFNISSSPDRLHQLIWRTRGWLKQENIPAQIVEDNGFYSLVVTGDFSFRVPLERKHVDLSHLHFNRLKSELQTSEFTLRQAMGGLGLSKATVWRLLSWAEEHGKLERVGSGSSTRYRYLESKLAG